MDVAKLALGQALSRVGIGAGLMIRPEVFGRVWVGEAATDEGRGVLARALGARDLALGAGGLLALRGGDRDWARRSFAAQAFADAVDLIAIATARRDPPSSRTVGTLMATGSAAVAGAYARRLSVEHP
jgi:hypothetical protein